MKTGISPDLLIKNYCTPPLGCETQQTAEVALSHTSSHLPLGPPQL